MVIYNIVTEYCKLNTEYWKGRGYKNLNDIKAGTSNRSTFLMGDEPYYIDIVSDYIEKMSCLKKKRIQSDRFVW
jgi:hypothetical protein